VTRDRGGASVAISGRGQRAHSYIQDKNGDENWHLYAVNLASGETRDLTPFENVRVERRNIPIISIPGILLGMNKRDPAAMDMYRLNIGDRRVDDEGENPGDYVGWMVDNAFVVRRRGRGARRWRLRAAAEERSRRASVVHDLGTGRPAADAWIHADNKGLYLADKRRIEHHPVLRMDIATREKKVIASDQTVDLGSVLIHPTKNYPQRGRGRGSDSLEGA